MESTHKKGIIKLIIYGFARHVRQNDIPDDRELDLIAEQIISLWKDEEEDSR
jgi:hypothetical protein